jgi:hypothetical protein
MPGTIQKNTPKHPFFTGLTRCQLFMVNNKIIAKLGGQKKTTTMNRRDEKFTDPNKPLLNTYYCLTTDIENDKRWRYTDNGGVLNGSGGVICKFWVS